MIEARDFSHLRGRLIGISDRALDQHLALYASYCRRLNDLEGAYPLVEWAPDGQQVTPLDFGSLVSTPVAKLELRPLGVLADCLATLDVELDARGIAFRPNFYLGDGEMWTTDRAVSVNIPWYLANPTLMRLAQRAPVPTYTADLLMRDIRHETGHAIGYAFEAWKHPEWVRLFGDFRLPYESEYTPDPLDRSFVEYTVGSPRGHYAQKHPDEAWAEAFAAWLDPASAWREKYADAPGALAKLDFIERYWSDGGLEGEAPNTLRGRTVPYAKLRGTVGDNLGLAQSPRPLDGAAGDHAELLRREPELLNGILLHELYFEAIASDQGGGTMPEEFVKAVVAAWGSVDSYLLDLRAIAGSTNGWALTVWDERAKRLRNALVTGHTDGVPAGCPVVVALDTWEHAFAVDHGASAAGKAWYLAAWFDNHNWQIATERLIKARGVTLTAV